MANAVTIQTLVDGPENTVLKLQGVLDTSDVSQTVLVDPATLSAIWPGGGLKATALRIKRIQHNIEDSLSVNLYWDATTPVRIGEFTGRATQKYESFGGLQNNAGTGKNGKILYETQGWATSATISFEIILHLGKQ